MLEQLLEFLLRNAYIVIALEGTDMFTSGKRAIKLLKENLLDVVALNQFGDIVMVVARIFVAALAGILCYTLVPVSYMQFRMKKCFTDFIILGGQWKSNRSIPSIFHCCHRFPRHSLLHDRF